MQSNKRIIFIGDIHGCIRELDMLLELVSPTNDDRIIFIGDLIDKGPDSAAVVRRFFELKTANNAKLILGNHEEKFLRYINHLQSGSGKEKLMKGTEEFSLLYKNLSDKIIETLKEAFYSIYLEDLGITALHGGISNKLHFDFPKDYQYSKHLPKTFKGLDLITKTRYLNPEGKFVGLGEEKETDKFWAEVYDGRYGKIVFGHQPFIQETPKIFPHAYGIDTGCVFGGSLNALVVENSEINFVSVKALDSYVVFKSK